MTDRPTDVPAPAPSAEAGWEEIPPPPGDLPPWLVEVVDGARSIRGEDLTAFLPPPGQEVRRGAVLMLLGERDVLLTERAHDMRSHPGQVSFPGGSIDPGETPVQAALREAEEEIGVDPAGVAVVARLPELWLPPSNFAVTPVIGWWREESPIRIASPAEVHAIHRVPFDELVDPAHRIRVRHPAGFVGPGFLIGPAKDVILWGFTGGILTRFLDFLGWLPPVSDPPMHDLPDHMLAEYAARTPRAAERPEDSMDILEPENGGRA